MARRRKMPAEAGKNKTLSEFLRKLNIEGEKRDRIVSFVEELTFKRMKELSTGVREDDGKKPKLRLKMPWQK